MDEYPDYRMLFTLRPGLFSEATLYNGYTDTILQMVRRAEMDLIISRTTRWLSM